MASGGNSSNKIDGVESCPVSSESSLPICAPAKVTEAQLGLMHHRRGDPGCDQPGNQSNRLKPHVTGFG